jgi:acyl carrier protein
LTDTSAIVVTDTNAIIERLNGVFVERFHIEVPSAEIDLLQSGILDSFQFVELLLELEQRFGFRIKLEDVELDDLRTLKRIAQLVAANGAAARPTGVQPRSVATDSP